MKTRVFLTALVATATLLLFGCGTPQSKLTYSALPTEGADGAGFPFVVPRTVVKVTPTSDKAGATESVAFTPVPLATRSDGKGQLPTFVATDSSTSGWSLTPTTFSSVAYLDDLIISAIGTQVTDNRKDAIDVVVTAASLAGAFASAAKVPTCASDVVPLKAFLIDKLDGPPQRLVPNVKCWAYTLESAPVRVVSRKAFPVQEISMAGTAAWFPIPACKVYKIRVFHCENDECTSERRDIQDYTTTLSISDGTQYQRIPLPSKGKISIHTDFCGADSTNESVGAGDWGLLKQLLSDVKTEKKK